MIVLAAKLSVELEARVQKEKGRAAEKHKELQMVEQEMLRVLKDLQSLRAAKDDADERIAHLLETNRRLGWLLRFGDGTKQRLAGYKTLLKYMSVRVCHALPLCFVLSCCLGDIRSRCL